MMDMMKEIMEESGATTRLLRMRDVEEDGEGGGGEDNNEESHHQNQSSGRPKEPWKGEFVKSIVYAGLDSIVTCFSLISSISASHRSSVDVLVLGIANLVADGISMGLGDYVSSSTEKEVAARERSLTRWDVSHTSVNAQLESLIHRYRNLGMSVDDATTVVDVFAKYEEILVAEKMAAEKGLVLDQVEKPWKNGIVTFLAFILFGSAPLLSFIVLKPFTHNKTVKFVGACLFSALALACLGIAKGKIAGEKYAFSVVITLLNGALAAAAAYSLGWSLKNWGGLED